MAKQKYYSLDRIFEAVPDATWFCLYGQRANGKSYSVKKYIIEEALKDNKFVYLRRWERDIKQDMVSSYFDDMPIRELTKGLYDGIIAYHGYLYFYVIDENDKLVKQKQIGRYLALNLNERYKSQTFEDYTTIVFEEFITDGQYLSDREPTTLQQLVSTIFRQRKGKVFMVANTLSRVIPYQQSFGIEFTKLKQGEIRQYNFHVGDDIVTIAVEYCTTSNYKNSMFFGKAAEQILSGTWDVDDQNKKPDDTTFECIYKILIEYQAFKFALELLVDDNTGGRICFIYPSTKGRTYDRILTDRFSSDPLISARLDARRAPEAAIIECFKLNKICYSDNLTGTDFKHVNEHFRIANMF